MTAADFLFAAVLFFGVYMMNKITSRKNEKAIHLKKLGADSGYRRKTGMFYCDGEKLLLEAVKNGAEIEMVFTCTELDVELPDSVQVYQTTYDIIESVSPMKTPQKVIFSCKKQPVQGRNENGQYIVLEDMQDPGNVGTVLRTAGAFGIDAVILVGACADSYNHKAVRASMGAIFRQPMLEMELEELKRFVRGNSITLIGAALSPESRDIRNIPLKNCAVAIGSEGHGLSKELLEACDRLAIIPMDERCESLNAAAAAAIVMWEMSR